MESILSGKKTNFEFSDPVHTAKLPMDLAHISDKITMRKRPKRLQSTVPTSCTQTESCVLDVNIQKAWETFSSFRFNEMSPNVVSAVEWTSGKPNQLGACAKITYKDGASWIVRFNELSEKHHRIGYELITADPPTECSSVHGVIQLLRITQTGQTFLTWTTEFSNDADLIVIQD